MARTTENSSSSSRCSCRTSNSTHKTGFYYSHSHSHYHYHYRCSAVVVKASIAALLLQLLLPTTTTTTSFTFSHAFRSGFPRRGSTFSVLESIGIGPKAAARRATATSRWSSPTFSRPVHTVTICRLFLPQRDNFCIGSNCRNGSVAVPVSFLHSRAITMTTSRTSLSATSSAMASSSFFTEPSKGEGIEEEEYTMESLCRYAEQLIATNNNTTSLQPNQKQNHRFCVYLAGGGSLSVSTLAATPGASSFLLEGRTTYDRHSYLNACEMPDRDTKGRGFSYGGEEAAGLAATAALKQALKLTSMDDDLVRMPLTIGIGCTSVLVSGEGSPSGSGTVVAEAADGLALTLTIRMKDEDADCRRSRFEEDLVLSHLVLRSAEQLMLYRENDIDGRKAIAIATASDREYVTRAGDVITERWKVPTPSALPLALAAEENSKTLVVDDIDVVVEEAAKRVVDRGEDAVVLLPLYEDGKPATVRTLSQTVLPNGSLVFPGSFNPVHVGHLALANASIKTLEKHEPYVHPRRHNDKPIFFELSLTNADKPSIDPKIVVARVKKFIELASMNLCGDNHDGDPDSNGNGDAPSSPMFPQQWGIVLTRAPLFEEKLTVLRSKVLNRLEGPGDSPKINFIIGTDTMVRILNPKYYRDKSRANMIESLLELKASGAGFIVGGRLEQTPPQPKDDDDDDGDDSSSYPQFVSGQKELVGLPDEVASVFTIMEESEFRVDLSSSEIRKEQEKKEKESSNESLST